MPSQCVKQGTWALFNSQCSLVTEGISFQVDEVAIGTFDTVCLLWMCHFVCVALETPRDPFIIKQDYLMLLSFRYLPAAVLCLCVYFLTAFSVWLRPLLTSSLKHWCFSYLLPGILSLSLLPCLVHFLSPIFYVPFYPQSHNFQNCICFYLIKPTSLSKMCLLSLSFTKQKHEVHL